MEDRFEAMLQRFVKDQVARLVQDEVDEAKKRMDARVPELAARIAVSVSSMLNDRDMESVIQIRVKPKL